MVRLLPCRLLGLGRPETEDCVDGRSTVSVYITLWVCVTKSMQEEEKAHPSLTTDVIWKV